MSLFSVNMKHVKAVQVDQDNVYRLNLLFETGGRFTTIDDKDADSWREFLLENNIFFTEK